MMFCTSRKTCDFVMWLTLQSIIANLTACIAYSMPSDFFFPCCLKAHYSHITEFRTPPTFVDGKYAFDQSATGWKRLPKRKSSKNGRLFNLNIFCSFIDFYCTNSTSATAKRNNSSLLSQLESFIIQDTILFIRTNQNLKQHVLWVPQIQSMTDCWFLSAGVAKPHVA